MLKRTAATASPTCPASTQATTMRSLLQNPPKGGMPAMESEHGGLFKAMRAKRKEGASPFGKRLHSFQGGMEELARALAADLEGCLRLETPVTAIEPAGAGWSVRLAEGGALDAASVVVALAAGAAADRLRGEAADLAPLLREVGLSDGQVDHILVENPKRILTPSQP